MEAPEQGDLVGEAVAPVEAVFANQEGGREFDPERGGGQTPVPRGGNNLLRGQRQKAQWGSEDEPGQDGADEVVAKVGQEDLAEYALGVQRAEPLQGHEDDVQNGQPGERVGQENDRVRG